MIKTFIRNKRYLALFLTLALPLSVIIANCNHQQKSIQPASIKQKQSLSQVFDVYGYNEPQQKKALEYLLQEAGIITPGNTLITQFPARKNSQELLGDILKLIQETQKHFTIRSGTQERWEISPSTWMSDDNEQIQTALNHLNVVNDINPTIKNPDVLCMLGSTFKNMQSRLTYMENLLKNGLRPKALMMLVGERYASINVDGNEQELLEIAQRYGLTNVKQVTETHLGKEAYRLSNIDKNILLHVIDTPKRDLPRPTTETTIMELITWLNDHPDVKTIVFVSSQPQTKYQEAVINEVLNQAQSTLTFEVVGSSTKEKPTTLSLVGAVGSYLWAKTPEVIEQLGITIDASHQEAFKSLYAKNPVMSEHINKLCAQE